MDKTEEIFRIFREIAYEGRRIRLLNLYKGIPISYPASIASIGQASVTVRTEKIQLVSMYLARETHIHSPRFPNLVRAGVVLVEAEKTHAMLSHFTYAPERLGELTQVRVQPGEAVMGAVIAGQAGPVDGEMLDISPDGVSVLLDEREIGKACQPGEPVRIQLQLPAAETGELRPPLELRGRIANLRTGLPEGRCRIGVEIEPEHPTRVELARFISQRQADLLREMRSIYELVSLETSEEPPEPPIRS